MSLIAVFALAVTGPGGALTDRIGARRMLLLATACPAGRLRGPGLRHHPAAVAVAFLFIGLNFGVSWPAFNALVAAVVSGPARQQYFGINFALVNLGIGLGGVIGGLFVDVDRPGDLHRDLPGRRCVMLVPIGLLLGPLRHVHGRADRPEGAQVDAGSYLAILRQPAVLWLTLLTFLGDLRRLRPDGGGLPRLRPRRSAEVSTRVIGFAFAVNTAVIVGLQFFVLGRISGRRRTRVLMVMSASVGRVLAGPGR